MSDKYEAGNGNELKKIYVKRTEGDLVKYLLILF